MSTNAYPYKPNLLPPDFLPQIGLNEIEVTGLLRYDKPKIPEKTHPEILDHYLSFFHRDDLEPKHTSYQDTLYYPSLMDRVTEYEGFVSLHPLQDISDTQGMLALLFECEQILCRLFGFSHSSFQPTSSLQAIYTGALMIKAYHRQKGHSEKSVILINDVPDARLFSLLSLLGFELVPIPFKNGRINFREFEKKLSSNVAACVVKTPNSYGIFEEDFSRILSAIKAIDAISYWDGEYAHSILTYFFPGASECDLGHINLTPTFSSSFYNKASQATTIFTSKKLRDFFPGPHIQFKLGRYTFIHPPFSIGKVHPFYGNISALIKTYSYIRRLGFSGLRERTHAYTSLIQLLKEKCAAHFHILFKDHAQFGFVLTLEKNRFDQKTRFLKLLKSYGVLWKELSSSSESIEMRIDVPYYLPRQHVEDLASALKRD